MLLSVIIPFYNGIDWLCEAVQSVLSQTLSDYEIIIINDGSPEDMTPFNLRFSGNIKIVYFLTENKGPAAARNFGIERAQGEYIAFLDADDLWEPDKIEKQINLMQTTGCQWSHTCFKLFSDSDEKTIKNRGFMGDVFLLSLIACKLATSAVVIESEVLIHNPELRFKSDWRYAEDTYLWIKLSKAYPIGLVKEPLTRIRLRGSNAGYQAKVLLGTRTLIWEFIKQEKKTLFSKGKIKAYIGFPYVLCAAGNKVAVFMEKKLKYNPRTVEFISKCLYVLPFLFFRLILFFQIRGNL